MSEEWISAHLFYNQSWDRLLIEGVGPFVRQVTKDQDASNSFFVRYYERGPHVRLRIKTHKPRHIEERLLEFFSSYFRLYPSPSPLQSGVDDYPNNSIQFIRYEPEIERYGGIDAMRCSEDLFGASSKVVLDVLSGQNGDVTFAAGAALQLHLALVYAFGYSREEARLFFGAQTIPNGLEQTEQNVKEIIASYSLRLQTVNSSIPEYCRQIWDCIRVGIIGDERLQFWLEAAMKIRNEIDNLIEHGQFYMPDAAYRFRSRPEYSYLLSSHVHMTNNRLGIATTEEPYLNYLLMNSFAGPHLQQNN
jgi:thiopeptide-type bacteriocin biosynthesis protein